MIEVLNLIAKSPLSIVSMCVFNDRLFVATSEGVFERREDGAFHELRFVLTEPAHTSSEIGHG